MPRFSRLQLAVAAIVLGLVALWVVRDPTPAGEKSPGAVTRWEYKVQSFGIVEEDAEKTAKSTEQILTKLGQDGWELDRVVQAASHLHGAYLILRRPKR
jgi:hypothetical protein